MQAKINYGKLLAYGMWRSVAWYRLATAGKELLYLLPW